jgi:hypothetical protein
LSEILNLQLGRDFESVAKLWLQNKNSSLLTYALLICCGHCGNHIMNLSFREYSGPGIRDEEDSWAMCKLDQELEAAGTRRLRGAGKMGERVGKKDPESTEVTLGSSVAIKPGKSGACCE